MYRLDYKGKGCRGRNLPFDSIAAAVAYARERRATHFEIRTMTSPGIIVQGSRKDCQHSSDMVQA